MLVGYKATNANIPLNFLGTRGSRLSLYDTLWTFVSNARYIPIFKEHAPATVPRHLKVCVRSTFRVVGLGGLEPPASPLSGVRSNHLSYRPKSRA